MEKIDLLYILGRGSRWSDNEIRYSLRSAEKNLNVNKVFIVGELPEWMTGVIHIPAKDESKNKLVNARAKYLAGINYRGLGDKFALMNDDFFILKPTEIKNYKRGPLSELIRRHPTMGGYYFKAMCATKNRLDAMGVVDPDDYEIHSPMIFEKEKLKTVIAMMGDDGIYLYRTAYGNLTNMESEPIEDFKACNYIEFLHQRKRDAEILSINDAILIDDKFREWLQKKFPEVSKYENDGGRGARIAPGRSMEVMHYNATKDFMYGGKQYTTGETVTKEVVDEIKRNPKLRQNWELK